MGYLSTAPLPGGRSATGKACRFADGIARLDDGDIAGA